MIGRQTGQNPLPSLTLDLRPRWLAEAIWRRRLTSGFTLIELLVVIGIMILLTVLLTPAFMNLKSAGDVTSSAYTIAGVLEQARTYAKANNTYTWVGFYEENTTDTTATTAAPPYTGKGRLLLATICSNDGTKIYSNNDPAGTLPTTTYKQLGKIVKLEGCHITDI